MSGIKGAVTGYDNEDGKNNKTWNKLKNVDGGYSKRMVGESYLQLCMAFDLAIANK